jgi:Fur family peroxide stress response transcriptional regulator
MSQAFALVYSGSISSLQHYFRWNKFPTRMTNRPSKRKLVLDKFEQICRRKGLPVTIQRRVVLEVLLGREDHPTADQIFEEVKVRAPGISRTTVYRVLETLVRLGVARTVCSPGASLRFDPNIEQHHHLVCLHCGKMRDLDDPRLSGLPLPDRRRTGFEVTDYTVHFRGTCADCQRKIKAAHPSKVKKRLGQRGS